MAINEGSVWYRIIFDCSKKHVHVKNYIIWLLKFNLYDIDRKEILKFKNKKMHMSKKLLKIIHYS